MIILGLNAFHGDSSAALIRNGVLIAAVEEERFRRIKHWAGLPTQAIDYCLREGRVELSDLNHIAINRQPGVNNWRRLGFVLTHRPHPKLVSYPGVPRSSEFCSSSVTKACAVSDGFAAKASAATPETIGAEKDVPSQYP